MSTGLRASIRWIRTNPGEWLQPLLLALVVAVATWGGFELLQPEIHDFLTFNQWFQADVPAQYNQLTSLHTTEHSRSDRHPLFPLFATVPVVATQKVTGLPEKPLVELWLSLSSAAWIALFWAALRSIGLTRAAATAFSAVAATSAAAIFSLPIPGYFVLGSVALVGALLVVARWERGVQPPAWLLVAVSAATLAFSTTQWMAGLAMLLFVAGPLRGALLALASLAVASAAFGVQSLIVDHTRFFLPPSPGGYLFGLSPSDVLGVFFGSAIAVPALPEMPLTVQDLPPAAGSWLAGLALVLWSALVAAAIGRVGAWRGLRSAQWIVLVLAGQLVLHLAFGDETFLYSIHWVPLLVAFAALGARGQGHRLVVGGAAVLAVLLAVHNGSELLRADEGLLAVRAQRAAFRDAVHGQVAEEELVVKGLPPRPGHADKPARPDPESSPPRGFLAFERRGWGLSYGFWDPAELDAFRRHGARFFVTDYAPGVADHAAIERLRRCFALRESRPDFVIVELVEPSCDLEEGAPAG